ncbi:phosphatidylinositol 5-phosphate 4-kinase [Anaeramoeba flamelloides]|uniref:Phosphatidylinositol 5-phosphate 4-kinase n=1 Tax=Anaeramoeba flamelloides TaxID=1746091 RepID=A0ABQ8X624_9EUKA|nr:phosphatidylinositol 5-phosphate 4-kinase [Anaeramoeba flamelloides]
MSRTRVLNQPQNTPQSKKTSNFSFFGSFGKYFELVKQNQNKTTLKIFQKGIKETCNFYELQKHKRSKFGTKKLKQSLQKHLQLSTKKQAFGKKETNQINKPQKEIGEQEQEQEQEEEQKQEQKQEQKREQVEEQEQEQEQKEEQKQKQKQEQEQEQEQEQQQEHLGIEIEVENENKSTEEQKKETENETKKIVIGISNSKRQILGLRKSKLKKITIKLVVEPTWYNVFNQLQKRSSTNQKKETTFVKFSEYNLNVFHNLRANKGITTKEYLESLSTAKTLNGTGGDSGSNFYITQDKQYLLKCINKDDSKTLKKIIKPYIKYNASFQNSLFVDFYGHYKIKSKNNCKYFVVMRNVFNTNRKIHKIYDLKGCTFGRDKTLNENSETTIFDQVFKDNDFDEEINLSTEIKDLLLEQIHQDIKFLNDFSLMDYSFLLGIHYLDNENQNQSKNKNQTQNQNQSKNENQNQNLKNISNSSSFGNTNTNQKKSIFRIHDNGIMGDRQDKNQRQCIYYFAIIDIFQFYSLRKILERGLKEIILSDVTISSVDPQSYSKRFLEMVDHVINQTENITEQKNNTQIMNQN